MVAYIRDLAVSRRQWLGEPELRNGIALCQSIPGATAIQVAAYVGLKSNGLKGALASYVGFGLPAFIVMLILSSLFVQYGNLPVSISLFHGLQVIVVAIVSNAVYSFGKGMSKTFTNYIFAVISATFFWLGISPFIVIMASAMAGLVFMKDNISLPPGKSEQREKGYYKGVFLLVILPVTGLICLYLLNDKLFDLASVMLQVDLFAFGGGFASVPLMLQKVVNVKGWIGSQIFMEGIALGQITPGPIVITATFVGYLFQGLSGAVVATIAIFTPSFLILVTIEPFFNRIGSSSYFKKATSGVLASFMGLLLFVGIKFAMEVPWDLIRAIMGLAAMTALLRKMDVLYIILAGVVISVLVL